MGGEPAASAAPDRGARHGMTAVETTQEALARLSVIDDLRRVLKNGESFAVFDRWGDIDASRSTEHGFFHEGTRYLSRLSLRVEGRLPSLLGSTIVRNNSLLVVELTNPAFDGADPLDKEMLHIAKHCFLTSGTCHLRLQLRSYAPRRCDLELGLRFGSDWADVFEARGVQRSKRGESLPTRVGEGEVVLGYRGLDDIVRRLRLTFTPAPYGLTEDRARYRLSLKSKEEVTLEVRVACEEEGRMRSSAPWRASFEALVSEVRERRQAFAGIYTTNELFNDWSNRSIDDFCQLLTEVTGGGDYPYAGIPWYSTPFGRDGIIGALQCLWLAPEVARGVLSYLSATQATEVDPERDAEPGKVIHEVRRGEMAALGEVPFDRYYGSVDATPLFLVLAQSYFRRTGDREFAESLLPSIEAALGWIDDWGDVDGDGFVEYRRRSSQGLVNQGWKDSWDSVFHQDGSLPDGPIALVEVQGYVYDAKRRMADLYGELGREERARDLEAQAAALRLRFEDTFWCEELGCYALGLDGSKRPLQVRSSNAGHALFSRIASPARARRVAALLNGPDFFSGWGVRTLAEGEARYNPMSYHNGSVWPHDNGIVALGMARYGSTSKALRILRGLFEASLYLEQRRTPELFCGFSRRTEEGPAHYPEANIPQAWAAGSVFMLLQACLGLHIDAPARRITLARPELPSFLERVELSKLCVRDASVDLVLSRHRNNVGVEVARREGDLEVRVVS